MDIFLHQVVCIFPLSKENENLWHGAFKKPPLGQTSVCDYTAHLVERSYCEYNLDEPT